MNRFCVIVHKINAMQLYNVHIEPPVVVSAFLIPTFFTLACSESASNAPPLLS